MLDSVTTLVIPTLILLCVTLAVKKKKSAFDTFIAGVKEGMGLFIQLFPSILAMSIAVSLLRACGFVDDLGRLLNFIIPNGDFFASMMPMTLFRPLSGSASLAVLHNACSIDPDGMICKSMSVVQASNDTTFYVITLYYSSIGVTKWRHSIKSGLTSDAFGMVAGIILALLFLS